MNETNDRLIRRSLGIYRLILRLYPRGFRERFGSPMADTFERLLIDAIGSRGRSGAFDVWRTVLAELAPTALRAHVDEALESPFPLPVRIAFAAALPLAAYVIAMRASSTTGQFVLLTTWLMLLAAGVGLARGRGWRCSRNAVVASAVGVLIPALNDMLDHRMPLESLRVLPLLVAAAGTIGFIVSVYVRLFIEGVRLRRTALV
jgi:hypothetical protein